MPCCAGTGPVEPRAKGAPNPATAAISSKINDLCRNRMKIGVVPNGRTLEASRRRQEESNHGWFVWGGPPRPPAANLHLALVILAFDLAGRFLLAVTLRFGAFAATISY